jgi:hypothetical protein
VVPLPGGNWRHRDEDVSPESSCSPGLVNWAVLQRHLCADGWLDLEATMRFLRLNGKVVRGWSSAVSYTTGIHLIWPHRTGIGHRVDIGVVSRCDELRAERDGLTWEQREAAVWEDLAADEKRRIRRRINQSHWNAAWNMALAITWVLSLVLPAVGVNPGLLVTPVYFALMWALIYAAKGWFDRECLELPIGDEQNSR